MLNNKQFFTLTGIVFLLGCLTFLLQSVLGYDDFITGPEAILLSDNEEYLNDYKNLIYHKAYVFIFYYLIDSLFAISLGTLLFSIINRLNKSIGFTFYNIFKWAAILYIIVDVLQNYYGLMYHSYSKAIPQSFYDGLNWAKLILVIILCLTILVLVIYEKWNRSEKRVIKEDAEEKKEDQKSELSDVLQRSAFGIVLSFGMLILLNSMDQGPVLLAELLSDKPNASVCLFFLLLIFGLTLISPYYSSKSNISKNKVFHVQKESVLKGLLLYYFDWTKEVAYHEKEYLIKNVSGLGPLFHRIFALSHIWIAIFIFCQLRISTMKIELGHQFIYTTIPPLVILLSILLLNKFQKHILVVDEKDIRETYKLNPWLINFFILGIFICIGIYLVFILTNSLGLIFSNIVFIALLIFFNFTLCFFLLFRRRISFYSGPKWIKSFVGCFCNDLMPKVFQVGVMILLISMAVYIYLNPSNVIYDASSINIILSAIIIITFLAQMISSFYAHYSYQENVQTRKILMRKLVFIQVLLVVSAGLLAKSYFIQDPQRTTIPKVSKDEKLSTNLRDFLIGLDEQEHYYFIANEGGGLRANYWSMKVLEKLDEIIPDSQFYKRIIATCGASGGAIGQGLYSIMKADSLKSTAIHSAINEIGITNFLARDVYSLVYPRFISKLYPIKFSVCDKLDDCRRRGDIAQAHSYGHMVSPDFDSYELSIESFWENAKKNNGGYFPIPIINATHVETGQEGVISPLSDQASIFNGSLIINQFESINQSISFINSLFLTNRFPIFSPPAIVPGKGTFIDAGVFDNNGLSSILDVMEYVEQNYLDELSENDTIVGDWEKIWNKLEGKVHLIIIQSGKGSYVKDLFKTDCEYNAIYSNSNLESSIKGATSSSAVKEYLKKVVDKKDHYFASTTHINLPYLLRNKSSVDQLIGGQLKGEESVMEKITRLDSRLIQTLDAANECQLYLDPPLGRILSDPVKNFIDTIIAKEAFDIYVDGEKSNIDQLKHLR